VHVRQTESLDACGVSHLELFGFKDAPTAARLGGFPSCSRFLCMTETLSRTKLRRLLRNRRCALSRGEQRRAARALYLQLSHHPLLRRARHVALYLPQDGEIDPRPLLHALWQRKKYAYLPVLSCWPRTRMGFQRIDKGEKLHKGRFGIQEPKIHPARQRRTWALDLLLLPLVGFDASGGRLGMGGGFYDRALAFRARRKRSGKPLLLGIAHECQKVECLDLAPWDVPLLGTVTDGGWYLTTCG